MTSKTDDIFEEFLDAPSEPLGMNPAITGVIADYLEEAVLSTSKRKLDQLSKALVSLINDSLRNSPKAVVQAAVNALDAGENERTAYLLGQISFAQLFASQSAHRRVSDDFVVTIKDVAYFSYVTSLYHGDKTNTDLLPYVSDKRIETVSRKLKRLRELGVTDFRREGTHIVNFLTPVAKAVFDDGLIPLPDDDGIAKLTHDKIAAETSKLKSHMRGFATFAHPQRKAC